MPRNVAKLQGREAVDVVVRYILLFRDKEEKDIRQSLVAQIAPSTLEAFALKVVDVIDLTNDNDDDEEESNGAEPKSNETTPSSTKISRKHTRTEKGGGIEDAPEEERGEKDDSNSAPPKDVQEEAPKGDTNSAGRDDSGSLSGKKRKRNEDDVEDDGGEEGNGDDENVEEEEENEEREENHEKEHKEDENESNDNSEEENEEEEEEEEEEGQEEDNGENETCDKTKERKGKQSEEKAGRKGNQPLRKRRKTVARGSRNGSDFKVGELLEHFKSKLIAEDASLDGLGLHGVDYEAKPLSDLNVDQLRDKANTDFKILRSTKNMSVRAAFSLGRTLEACFRQAKQDKKKKWPQWVEEHLDVSTRTADRMRQLYRDLGMYPHFQRLAVPVKHLTSHINDIKEYLKSNPGQSLYWKRQ